jgi:hypothetical protein
LVLVLLVVLVLVLVLVLMVTNCCSFVLGRFTSGPLGVQPRLLGRACRFAREPLRQSSRLGQLCK